MNNLTQNNLRILRSKSLLFQILFLHQYTVKWNFNSPHALLMKHTLFWGPNPIPSSRAREAHGVQVAPPKEILLRPRTGPVLEVKANFFIYSADIGIKELCLTTNLNLRSQT